MFTVVCISEGHSPDKLPPLIVGNYYTVVREHQEPYAGRTLVLYILQEIGEGSGYGKGNFALISSIDEREFVRDYNKETV